MIRLYSYIRLLSSRDRADFERLSSRPVALQVPKIAGAETRPKCQLFENYESEISLASRTWLMHPGWLDLPYGSSRAGVRDHGTGRQSGSWPRR